MRYFSHSAALLVLLAACQQTAYLQDAAVPESDGTTSVPGDARAESIDAADATPQRCDGLQPLIIGQCIDLATDEPCLSSAAPQRAFVPISEDDVIRPIVGPQGSPMFVMAVKGSGIAPGEALDAPFVNLALLLDGESVGSFVSRSPLVDAPGSTTDKIALQLFTVVFSPNDLLGQRLDVVTELTDRNEEVWCGVSDFEVGVLLDGQPL